MPKKSDDPTPLPPVILRAADRMADAEIMLERQAHTARQAISEVLLDCLPAVRQASAEYDTARSALLEAVARHRPIFGARKGRSYRTIKFGFAKIREKVEVPNPAYTIEQIENTFQPEVSATMVQTTKKVLKASLKKLPESTLKDFGVSITGGEDEAFVDQRQDLIEEIVQMILNPEMPKEEKA